MSLAEQDDPGLPSEPERHPTPARGPGRAVTETPELAIGAARRTTSIDMTRPEGLAGPLVADIRGRDLVRIDGHGAEVIDVIDLQVCIDRRTAQIASVTGSSSAEVGGLVGISLRRGFGAAVIRALSDAATRRALLYSALEDLNGAHLVAGYASLRAGLLVASRQEGEARAAAQEDVCAGWARGGAVVELLRRTGTNAVPLGPVAPPIAAPEGSWHDLAPLALHTVRRLRCLDVRHADHGDVPSVRSHFRDSYQGADEEMVMHEYVVTTGIDPAGRAVRHLEVDPRVLPWETCPAAAASAVALDGTPFDELPARVRAELVGPGTCTHLNSTVRALADVRALLGLLDVEYPA